MHHMESPTRETPPFELGSPHTPRHQTIPDPVLRPPQAPQRPRNLSHWRSRPCDESLTLRNYFLNLPTGGLLDQPSGQRKPTTLQEYFEQTQQVLQRKEQDVGQTENPRVLNFVPQLAANVAIRPRRELRIRTCTPGRVTCFSCGSADCGTADYGDDSPMVLDRTSISAPLPLFRPLADDSDEDLSPGCGKRKGTLAGDDSAVKRTRSTSQTQLPPLFSSDVLITDLIATSPLPPATPSLAMQAFGNQAEGLKGQSLRFRSLS